MKKVIFGAMALSLLFATSCKKDDDTTTTDTNTKTSNGSSSTIDLTPTSSDNEINAAEDIAIALATLEDGLNIESSSKVTGMPPAANGDVEFKAAETELEGNIESGFSIGFDAGDDVTGVYVVLKDQDGNYGDEYFDVDLEPYSSNYKVASGKKGTHLKVATDTETDYVLDIDFDETITAGSFCVELCVYTDSGFVSVPTDICVEVEAWGGLEGLAGEYELASTENYENGDLIEEYYQTSSDVHILVLEENGEYYEEYIYSEEGESDHDKYWGNWSYNEDDVTLTLVDFGYEDLISGETEEYPDGSIYLFGSDIEVDGNELRISTSYTEEGSEFTTVMVFELSE